MRMDQMESGMTFQMDDGKAIWMTEKSYGRRKNRY